MTVREVLEALARQWFVSAAVLLVFAALAASFLQQGGLYTTRTVIAFDAPGDMRTGLEAGGSRQEGAIAFAGAVVDIVNEGRPVEAYAQGDAPIYGAGLREAVAVALTSDGSQWAESHGHAEIEVQVVGTSEAWVAAQQADRVAAVLAVADTHQDRMGVAGDARIRATVDSVSAQIFHIVPGGGATVAALGALAAVALTAAAAAATGVDRARRQRRARARGAGASLRLTGKGSPDETSGCREDAAAEVVHRRPGGRAVDRRRVRPVGHDPARLPAVGESAAAARHRQRP